jgi:hypothetical protein
VRFDLQASDLQQVVSDLWGEATFPRRARETPLGALCSYLDKARKGVVPKVSDTRLQSTRLDLLASDAAWVDLLESSSIFTVCQLGSAEFGYLRIKSATYPEANNSADTFF